VQNTSESAADPLALVVSPALFQALVDQVAERRARRAEPAVEPWVGVAEAARHLGCKPQRIYDLVSRRATSGIPHRKEGGRLLFRLTQLTRWIDSGAA
jgi:hypothetical protein